MAELFLEQPAALLHLAGSSAYLSACVWSYVDEGDAQAQRWKSSPWAVRSSNLHSTPANVFHE